MTRRAACLALLLLVIPGLDGGVARGGSHFDPRAAPPLEAGGGGATVEIDKSEWQKQSFRHDVSPVDLSSLNHKPAGKHGFLVRRGEALEFEDGTPARFWGANVTAHGIFRPEEEIETQARRLSRLGYNLVRIHHHDSTGWVSPTVIDKSRSDTRQLDAQGIASLDYWIKCLADEGVYVFLDLHVGRQLEEGDETTALGTVTTFDEMKEYDLEVKGFAQYEPTLQKLMVEFQEKYLGHVNPHRGKAYKDDPAIVGLLLTNENDITHHFGNTALAKRNNPVLGALFRQARRDFARASGLSEAKMYETWLPGESKIFLNHQEHLFNQVLLGSLARLGVGVPVATTSMWGKSPCYSLPALTDGSLIDVHAYQGQGFLEADPRTTAIGVHWIAAAQVAGFPVAVSEWNMVAEKGAPSPDRHAAAMFMTAAGGLQGWDAPMIFNYSNAAFTAPTAVRGWVTFADPGLQAAMPAAALAFRQGHVAPGAEVYCLELDRESLYFEEISPETSAAIRTIAERSRLRICLPDIPELPWDEASPRPAGAVLIRDHREDHQPAGKDYVESDTGELRRYWPLGIQTINTAATQAALGKIGGRKIELGNLSVEVSNPEATVVVSALDGESIGESGELLITTVGRVEAHDGDPYVSEPVIGALNIETTAGKTLVPLAPDGSEGAAIAARYDDGAYTIALDRARFSHWYLLR
jgi:hypothetical protein